MKHTLFNLVVISCLLTIASCSKEDRPELNLNAAQKSNHYQSSFKTKDFKLKTIRNTITYSPSLTAIPVKELYELIYNNRGDIDRINITTTYNDLVWKASYQAYFKGARMDSVSRYSFSGSGPFFSGFKYKGNQIVGVLFYSGYQEPEKKIFEYSKKGELLNGLIGMRFIYDENGLLVRFVYPNEYFNSSFEYERTYNPLFIENLHLFLTYGNLNELCYSQWNIVSKVQGGQVIDHTNSYDELGRLKTKKYSQDNASYFIEFGY